MAEMVSIGARPWFQSGSPAPREARDQLASAVARATDHLLSLQAEQGYWLGELEADTTLESDYIFYLHVLGRLEPRTVAKLTNYVRRRQLCDGGWNTYVGGPAELNASIKGYVALKLAGDAAQAPHMQRARQRILDLGGVEAANSFTRFYLALGGALDWNMLPAIPPELMLLPRWSYVNLYEMSSWTRGIVVPLMILYAHRPAWRLPAHAGVEELFRDAERKAPALACGRKPLSWRNFFLLVDRALKGYEKLPWKPFRKRALARATRWLFEHLERSDGLGAIYPAMMNSIFALLALGRGPDDPLTAREIHKFAGLTITEPDTIRVQPCLSPVWDTAIAMVALEEAGLPPDHHALVRAAQWLLEQQITGPGDWQAKNPAATPAGWAFEFRNDFYPDVDDTAFVLMALRRVEYLDRERMEAALHRGLAWLVSMQNRDGGWGAFDRNNDRALLTQIPFADHNAMIDPSTADVTARVVECLGRFGWQATHPVIQRALEFLRRDQNADGSWYGRWGVNYVYGTGGVLRALEAIGLAAEPFCQSGAAWLRSVQKPDGGYGESIASYDDPGLKGTGPTTASQTAWGLIGLLATSEARDPSVQQAVSYLLEHQNAEGTWDEVPFTGTGFPRVFYLKYHLYRHYFPLYALARYHNSLRSETEAGGIRIPPARLMNGAH